MLIATTLLLVLRLINGIYLVFSQSEVFICALQAIGGCLSDLRLIKLSLRLMIRLFKSLNVFA